MRNDDQFFVDVVEALLQRHGIGASYEYPGFISIDTPDRGGYWAFGDANGWPWTGDFSLDDGTYSHGVTLPADTPRKPPFIAAAIATAIKGIER